MVKNLNTGTDDWPLKRFTWLYNSPTETELQKITKAIPATKINISSVEGRSKPPVIVKNTLSRVRHDAYNSRKYIDTNTPIPLLPVEYSYTFFCDPK